MTNCIPMHVSLAKRHNKFVYPKYSKIKLESIEEKNVPYVLIVRSLMNSQNIY